MINLRFCAAKGSGNEFPTWQRGRGRDELAGNEGDGCSKEGEADGNRAESWRAMRLIFDDAEKLYLFEATEDAEWRRKGQGRWCRRDRLAKLPRGAVGGPQRQQQGVVVAAAHGARNAVSRNAAHVHALKLSICL